jgi:hypothetical protein
VLTTIFFSCSLLIYGQNDRAHQIWLDFNPSYKLNDKFQFKGTVGFKTVYPKAWNKVHIKPELVYKMRRLFMNKLKYNEKLIGGVEFHYINNFTKVNFFEVTPYQAYQLTWPNRPRIDIKHNVKLKERIQWEASDWKSSFGLQLIYEASVVFKFQGDLWQYGKGFYVPVSFKFYWNLKESSLFNDVMRITPGIGYSLSHKWKVALLSGYNRTRGSQSDEFRTNNIIYRCRVYYTIK